MILIILEYNRHYVSIWYICDLFDELQTFIIYFSDCYGTIILSYTEKKVFYLSSWGFKK